VATPPAHEPLTPLDQLLFHTERDAALRAGGIGVFVLDSTPAWSDVEYTFEHASRGFLRLRQRVVEPTGGIGPAHWVVDPNFDIRYHVRRVELPEGTTLRTVIDRLEIELMSPLELERPLWHATLYEGLDGGQSVLALRGGHAIGDGLGSNKVMGLLFDSGRRARRKPMPPAPVADGPTADEILAENLQGLPGAALGGLRGLAATGAQLGGHLLRHPLATATEARELLGGLPKLLQDKTTASSPLSGRSLSRGVMWTELSLSELKRASHAIGGSINDGFLAALCGALRRYHEALGTPVDTLSLVVAIATRRDGDQMGGNHFTGGLLEAPVGEADPARRIREIHAQVEGSRKVARFDVMGMAVRLLAYLPISLIGRILRATPMPVIQTSNLPGSQSEYFLAGARVQKMLGIGPVPGMAMMVGLTSHLDASAVTVTYDPAAIRDAKLFQRCLEEGFSEILALAPPDEASGSETAPR
jgi:diacylglycerol O-acyltransferase